MSKRQFKAESKRLLDLMINSIYTNKEIFLRELISNANDALDKLAYISLTDKKIKVDKKNLLIKIIPNKDERTLTIVDNGIGMNKEELIENLGTIAKSGSLAFKEAMDKKKDPMNIIGQFGVGFYSSFMVSKRVEVISKKAKEEIGYKWVSEGKDGFDVSECDKSDCGTTIKLYLKDNINDENYDEYLDDFKLMALIKKYSDYVTYPIYIDSEEFKNNDPVNSMVPLWKKDKKKIKDEEYYNFYQDRFFDYSKPLKVIHTNVEGLVSYNSIYLYHLNHLMISI